jgi:RNA recognition motif-containing protein
MGTKLYVGNLPYNVTEEKLHDHFAQHGAVLSARIISDKFTGKSKGFGFVEMSSDQEAEKAISALNGTDFEGRNIVVSEARPQSPRSSRPGGSGGGFGGGGFGGGSRGRERY